MGFLKAFFGGRVSTPEEEKKEQENKQFDVLKYDGVRALRTGQADYAVKCFEHALQLQDELETREYLSQAYVATNDLAKADAQLEKLLEMQPDNVSLWLRKAEIAYMADNYDAMSEACEKASAIDGENATAHYLNARAYIGKGNSVVAIAMLTKTISIDETFADAYLLRAQTLLEAGDVKSAEEDVAWLMQNVGDNEDVLVLKARIEERKGNHEESLATYGKVIELNPFNAVAFRERGAIRLQQGDKQGAEEDMKQLLEIQPNLASDVNGEFRSEGSDAGIQQQVEQAYRNSNPFGI